MAKKTVEFDAHETVKKPTEPTFTTKTGKEVDLTRRKKPVRIFVHVKFTANTKK